MLTASEARKLVEQQRNRRGTLEFILKCIEDLARKAQTTMDFSIKKSDKVKDIERGNDFYFTTSAKVRKEFSKNETVIKLQELGFTVTLCDKPDAVEGFHRATVTWR